MNTTEKGSELENKIYDFFIDQINRDETLFDIYPADRCEVYKKKKYYCKERGGDVEFDIVIEIRRKGNVKVHLFVILECKNHQNPIQERDVTDFSDKIRRIFGHSVKGFLVSSSRLQSGAESIARNRRLGIVKFDENGLEVIAERKGGNWAESRFIQTQIFDGPKKTKSLKFSAYNEGKFFGSVSQLLKSFAPDQANEGNIATGQWAQSVPFVPDANIEASAQESLGIVRYNSGAVDLEKLCAELALELTFSKRAIHDSDGNPILGSANFGKRSIEVNQHGNPFRERFTIAHEIGHFCLRHDQYLHSECIVEHDLFADAKPDDIFNYERLEFQANTFASYLLLPKDNFARKTAEYREYFGISDRGHGYIFVDDQPCNYGPYNYFLSCLSSEFEVSMQAIEIRLKKMALLTDHRKSLESLAIPPAISKRDRL